MEQVPTTPHQPSSPVGGRFSSASSSPTDVQSFGDRCLECENNTRTGVEILSRQLTHEVQRSDQLVIQLKSKEDKIANMKKELDSSAQKVSKLKREKAHLKLVWEKVQQTNRHSRKHVRLSLVPKMLQNKHRSRKKFKSPYGSVVSDEVPPRSLVGLLLKASIIAAVLLLACVFSLAAFDVELQPLRDKFLNSEGMNTFSSLFPFETEVVRRTTLKILHNFDIAVKRFHPSNETIGSKSQLSTWYGRAGEYLDNLQKELIKLQAAELAFYCFEETAADELVLEQSQSVLDPESVFTNDFQMLTEDVTQMHLEFYTMSYSDDDSDYTTDLETFQFGEEIETANPQIIVSTVLDDFDTEDNSSASAFSASSYQGEVSGENKNSQEKEVPESRLEEVFEFNQNKTNCSQKPFQSSYGMSADATGSAPASVIIDDFVTQSVHSTALPQKEDENEDGEEESKAMAEGFKQLKRLREEALSLKQNLSRPFRHGQQAKSVLLVDQRGAYDADESPIAAAASSGVDKIGIASNTPDAVNASDAFLRSSSSSSQRATEVPLSSADNAESTTNELNSALDEAKARRNDELQYSPADKSEDPIIELESASTDEIGAPRIDDVESASTDETGASKIDDVESVSTDETEAPRKDDVESVSTDETEAPRKDDVESVSTDESSFDVELSVELDTEYDSLEMLASVVDEGAKHH